MEQEYRIFAEVEVCGQYIELDPFNVFTNDKSEICEQIWNILEENTSIVFDVVPWGNQ